MLYGSSIYPPFSNNPHFLQKFVHSTVFYHLFYSFLSFLPPFLCHTKPSVLQIYNIFCNVFQFLLILPPFLRFLPFLCRILKEGNLPRFLQKNAIF